MSGMAATSRRLVQEAVGKGAADAYSKTLRAVANISLEDVVAQLMALQLLLAEGLKKPKEGERELSLGEAMLIQVKIAKLTLEVAEAYRVRGGGLPNKVVIEFPGGRAAITESAIPNGERPAGVPDPPTHPTGAGGDRLVTK